MKNETLVPRESPPADPELQALYEELAKAGCSIPTRTGMAPWRLVHRRPKWLAFLLRLFT
jgi:hypothetical protein